MVKKLIQVAGQHYFAFLQETILPETLATVRDQLNVAEFTIRIKDCTIQIHSFREWLELPHLKKIQIENSLLTTEQATQLAIELLEMNSSVQVNYTPPEAHKDLQAVYGSPIWYYDSLQVWKQAWWLEPSAELPAAILPLVTRYQHLLNQTVLMQMRYYRATALHCSLLGEFLIHPEFIAVIDAAKNIFEQLKQLSADCPSNTSATFVQLINDLNADVALYLPQSLAPVSIETFQYFTTLDYYKKLRLILASGARQLCVTKHIDYPLGMFNYTLNSCTKINTDTKPLNALMLLLALYCQDLNIMTLESLHAEQGNAMLVSVFQLSSEIHKLVLKLSRNPEKIQPYHLHLLIPLHQYTIFLEKQLFIHYDNSLAEHSLACVSFLLTCLQPSANNAIHRHIFTQTVKHFSRVEEVENQPKEIRDYVKKANNIVRPYLAKIRVSQVRITHRPLQGIIAQQLWLLEKHSELNNIYIHGIIGRVTARADTQYPNRPTAFFALSKANQRLVIGNKLLGWDTKSCSPPFEPFAKNSIIDVNDAARHRRVLFEKIIFYIFDNLKDLPNYLTELKKIHDSWKKTQYPSMMFCASSSTITIGETLNEQHIVDFLHGLVAAYSMVVMPSIEEFKLPTLQSLKYVTIAEIKHAEHYFALVSSVCQLLSNSPEIAGILNAQLTPDIAEKQKKSYKNVFDLCQLRSTKLQELVANHEVEAKKTERKIWEEFTKVHQPVSLKVKQEKNKNKMRPTKTNISKSAEKKKSAVVPKTNVIKREQEIRRNPLPSYLQDYAGLKNIYILLDQKKYDAVILNSQKLLGQMLSEGEIPEFTNYPNIAYLYYAIAESMGMQSPRAEESVIFDMLYRGYDYAKQFIESDCKVDTELMDIMLFLIDETESSPLFTTNPMPVATPELEVLPTITALPISKEVTYQIDLPEVVRRLQDKLFTFFKPDSQYFYGSFVSVHLITFMHPNQAKLSYSDVDIVIITEHYKEALDFAATLEEFKQTSRPGLFTGTFEKCPFDIQIIDAHCMDIIGFANTLGIGCRSGIANHLGVCFDFTKVAFSDVSNKLTRFLSSTNLETNQLAIFNHIRTQAQFRFSSNEHDDNLILKNRDHLLKLPSWLLRDYFSRHFQSGFAEVMVPLWKKYYLFELLWPSLNSCTEIQIIELAQSLDLAYQRIQKTPYRITFLLAQFAKLVMQQQSFIGFSAPLLQALPEYAMSTITDTAMFRFYQPAVTRLPEASAPKTLEASRGTTSPEL